MARMSANERRQQVLKAATVEFAKSGYFGASTQAIAERAGVSQPYLFQLFGSKIRLFIAVWNACCDRLETVLKDAANDVPSAEKGQAITSAYDALLADEQELLTIQLQAWAASCNNETIRTTVSSRFESMWELVTSLLDAPNKTVTNIMGEWVLYNVTAALDIGRVTDCTANSVRGRTSKS